MLKDLQNSLSKHHIAVVSGSADRTKATKYTDRHRDIIRDANRDINREIRDTDAACNIVEHIFRSIDTCIREDKSKIKLSMFAKSFIKGIMTDNVKNSINDFVRNMDDRDIKNLLNDIQLELDKRK